MNGMYTKSNRTVERGLPSIAAFAALSAVLLASASQVCLARTTGQKTFATAQKATAALYQAIRKDDKTALTAILGTRKRDICADDAAKDKRERALFVRKYQEMRRLVREPDGTTALYIGAENWPFPFPLASSKGAWRFDTEAGMREIVFRHIGRNETATIQTCRAFVAPGAYQSLQETSAKLMHGYYFRALPARSGSAFHRGKTIAASNVKAGRCILVAYPVEYRSSGVMTFLVRSDGAVYAKDLGANTGNPIRSASGLRPDSTWKLEK